VIRNSGFFALAKKNAWSQVNFARSFVICILPRHLGSFLSNIRYTFRINWWMSLCASIACYLLFCCSSRIPLVEEEGLRDVPIERLRKRLETDRCIYGERSYTWTKMFDKQSSELVVGGAVASWWVRSSPDRAVRVRALGPRFSKPLETFWARKVIFR